MKNILVLTGSPRKNGNSDIMADSFIKGAQEKGNTVVKFQTAHKKIAGCLACDKCWSTGTACVIKDDFNELEKLLEEADTLVFASPIYWFGLSAQLKTAIDRIYAYGNPNAKATLKIKESVLLLCAADANMAVFDGAVRTHELMLTYLQWKNAGILLAPHASTKGDILKTPLPNQAEKLGKNI